ncbi:hypothetical protein HUN27_25725, partial [Agrobacterium tumefaciens]|nr:hypothetical protein [Agrobacterium tumefaciens]
ALAYNIKMAAKRQREQAHLDKLKRAALKAKKQTKFGGHSELPTDHDWESIEAERTRFFDDKRIKGANRCFEAAICNL